MPALPAEQDGMIATAEVPPQYESKDVYDTVDSASSADSAHDISEDDLKSLRRVSGKITWMAYTIAFVELCERFSYYGSTVVFTNFVSESHNSSKT